MSQRCEAMKEDVPVLHWDKSQFVIDTNKRAHADHILGCFKLQHVSSMQLYLNCLMRGYAQHESFHIRLALMVEGTPSKVKCFSNRNCKWHVQCLADGLKILHAWREWVPDECVCSSVWVVTCTCSTYIYYWCIWVGEIIIWAFLWLIWCLIVSLKVKDNCWEHPEREVGATLTAKAFQVVLVVVMRREWLHVNDGEKGHSISAAPPAELRMARCGGAPRGCQGHRRPPWRALAGEGARGATSMFLCEIELSVISHCDSQADHMDNSISRGCVPVRQQAF